MSTDCATCPEPLAPVMPTCNVTLPDGTYTNATVTVENGCITAITTGLAPLYQPTNCCDSGGSGGSGIDGLDGPPGPAGAAATVAVGTVTTVAAGLPATVTNSGTSSAAVLDFQIPRGAAGADGADPSGVTNTTAGIEFTNGSLQTLPVTWPPVLTFDASVIDTAGITLTFTKDPTNGAMTATLNLATFVTDLNTSISSQVATATSAALATMDTALTWMETQIISLQKSALDAGGNPSFDLDLDGSGTTDPGGTPGVAPPPPHAHN